MWPGASLFEKEAQDEIIFYQGNALAASLVGVTSLIFRAKGNPAGQALIIIFRCMYGYSFYTFAYYGEITTCLTMTAGSGCLGAKPRPGRPLGQPWFSG